MKAIYLEGTPEEVQATLKNLASEVGAEAMTAAVAVGGSEEEPEGEKYVSYKAARAILERKPLNKSHRIMLGTLAESHPNYVSSHDLMIELGHTSEEFRGFMGAFGRRISYTEEWDEEEGDGEFFDKYWDQDLACNQYRLAETVLKAVNDLSIVK